MESQFWHERWALREIGFHQAQANGLLVSTWSRFAGPIEDSEVFVPLCGKSLDMVWLRGQGHRILGVELSPVAVSEFFQEQSLDALSRYEDGFEVFEAGGFRLMCGDFFRLTRKSLGKISVVYDRAALIALPEALQVAYVHHLRELMPHRPPILLITLDYDGAEMTGPPFATSTARVQSLFEPAYRIAWEYSREVIDENPGLRGRGLSRLTETAYWLCGSADRAA